MTEMDNLFLRSNNGQNAVFLVDASGSVFAASQGKKILDHIHNRIIEICTTESIREFRIMFWNSDNNTNDDFQKGVKVVPFVVRPENCQPLFVMLKGNSSYLTYTWLAFDNMPREWIHATEMTNIYLITDGQIGWGNMANYQRHECYRKLADALKRLCECKRINIHIITVEATYRDHTNVNELLNAAGCDVFNVVRENSLTDMIASFRSYTPNEPNGFVHFRNTKGEPGTYPFRNLMFQKKSTPQFIEWIKQQIIGTTDMDQLIGLVNDLAVTIHTIHQDKPLGARDSITNMFCRMFEGTLLEPNMVRYMLDDSLTKKSKGQAELITNFRHNVKNLFRQADAMLTRNVIQSLGLLDGQVMTLPLWIADKMIIVQTGSRLVTEDLFFNRKTYNKAAIRIDDRRIPIIPILDSFQDNHLMTNQCTRQWMRIIMGNQFRFEVQSDTLMYLAMGLSVLIQTSDVPDPIKQSYRRIATIMMGKKRLNRDITEIEYLIEGNPPMPNNGNSEDFNPMMQTVMTRLKFSVRPYTMWFAMCLATRNVRLIEQQIRYCREDIDADFPYLLNARLDYPDLLANMFPTLRHIDLHIAPETCSLEYKCLITLEDTNEMGGWVIVPHKFNDVTCRPNQVFSSSGYEQFHNNMMCPICYTRLTTDDFRPVGPQTPIPDILRDVLSDQLIEGTITDRSAQSIPAPIATAENSNQSRHLIFMKGTVGSGKTTTAEIIKQQVIERGGSCLVIGMDQYSKNGISHPDARRLIAQEITEFSKNPDDLLVLVIDTCGDRANPKDVFGLSLESWIKSEMWSGAFTGHAAKSEQLKQYMAWSLSNVLARTACTAESKYWLNPHEAGLGTCIDVHLKKSKLLLGKNKVKPILTSPINIHDALDQLKDGATQYATYLAGINMCDHVKTFLDKKNIT